MATKSKAKKSSESKSVDGIIWKLGKTGLLGSVSWKKKWYYCDSKSLLSWKGETKPASGSKPNKTYRLEDLDFQLTNDGEFAFKIIDFTNGEDKPIEMIHEVESEKELIKWWKIFLGKSFNLDDFYDERDALEHIKDEKK